MKRIKFLFFIFFAIIFVTNGETDEIDYGDDGETTVIPKKVTTKVTETTMVPKNDTTVVTETTTLPESITTEVTKTTLEPVSETTEVTDISMSTTSPSSESTTKKLEQDSHKMNMSQTLSIFSLKNIESKFNDLITKLDSEQSIYMHDTKNSSNILEHEYKSVIDSHIQNITAAIDEFKENFELYKKIKNETEEKVQEVRENYIREIYTIESNWINEQINYYKEHDKLINKKQMYTTLEKLYKADNKTENIVKAKKNFDEIDRKIQNDSTHLKEVHQSYLKQFNLAQLKMTDELLKLLNDTKYDEVSKYFENFLNIKKTIQNLVKNYTDYSVKTNGLITDFTKKLSNLSSQLVLSKIMPSDNENVKIFSKRYEIPVTKTSQSSDMTNYKWVEAYQGNRHLSEHAAIGGRDVDGVPFYVARKEDYKSYLYGKFAFSLGRRHAYFPYEYAEYGVEKFEILTSPNYIWCDFDDKKNYSELPICRAEHNSSVIPGTLEKNGVCRIGYNFKVYRYSKKSIKVLRIGGC
ncbi:nuclease SbcCD subunit C-like [Chironomus tepperi]|uniref:nuclease SbcCD subunit C-like n=1 Tax=Chironomus tepperi TaxID=113505 RepID=UPI00391FA491